MGKKRKRESKRNTTRASPGPAGAGNAPPDWPVALLAGAGLVLTGVLIWSASAAGHLPYCSEGSSCEVVQTSAWSRFLGIPLTLWGFANYAVLGLVAVLPAPALQRWRWTAVLAAAGFGISIYLTLISIAVLEAVCGYCVASLVVMAALFGSTFRGGGHARKAAWRGGGIGLAVVVSVMMHLDALGVIGGGGGAVDPYLRDLAQHLDRRGFKFYGASWCPVCQAQKKMFGAAAGYLPYVECSPHGRGSPRATVCELEEIRTYPTWKMDGRRVERQLEVKDLATYSGFRAPGNAAAERE